MLNFKKDANNLVGWVAKHFNLGKDNSFIEIKRRIKSHSNDTVIFIIVGLDGWNHKRPNGGPKETIVRDPNMAAYSDIVTRGANVRFSMNGCVMLTFAQFSEIQQVIDEARQILTDCHNSEENILAFKMRTN